MYELIVRIKFNKYKKGLIWCKDGSFISPSKFNQSDKVAFGYLLEDNKAVSLRKSEVAMSWRDSLRYCEVGRCPDRSGKLKSGYMPSKDEVLDLYDSIMSDSGEMHNDLLEAGFTKISCNYTSKCVIKYTEFSWMSVCSCSEYISDIHWCVLNNRVVSRLADDSLRYSIPFYDFSK